MLWLELASMQVQQKCGIRAQSGRDDRAFWSTGTIYTRGFQVRSSGVPIQPHLDVSQTSTHPIDWYDQLISNASFKPGVLQLGKDLQQVGLELQRTGLLTLTPSKGNAQLRANWDWPLKWHHGCSTNQDSACECHVIKFRKQLSRDWCSPSPVTWFAVDSKWQNGHPFIWIKMNPQY